MSKQIILLIDSFIIRLHCGERITLLDIEDLKYLLTKVNHPKTKL